MNFLEKKFPKISNRQYEISEFKLLKEQLNDLMKNDFEKETLSYFDFITWVDSKIEGRPLLEIVKEKSTNKGGRK